jgi:hypothetical protein
MIRDTNTVFSNSSIKSPRTRGPDTVDYFQTNKKLKKIIVHALAFYCGKEHNIICRACD